MTWFKKTWGFALLLLFFSLEVPAGEAVSSAKTSTDDSEILAAVIVEGNRAFSIDELLDAYSDLLGEAIDKELLHDLRTLIAGHYQSQGLLAPQVVVAKHSRSTNVVSVTLREAQLGQFDLQPRSGRVAESLRKILVAYRFSEQLQHSDIDELTRQLKSIDGADVDVDLVRRGGDGHIYDLLIVGKPRFEMQFGVSNEGGQLLGPELANLSVGVNAIGGSAFNLGAFHVRTVDNAAFEQSGVYLEYDPDERRTLSLTYSDSDSLDVVNVAGDVTYDTNNWSLAYRYTPILDLRKQLDVGLELRRRDHNRHRTGVMELDQVINSATLSGRYNYFGKRISSYVLLALTQGIDGLGAKEEDTSLGAVASDLDFLKANARVINWFGLPLKMTARFELGAQYTDDVLPLSQVFALGGRAYVRAYEPGEFIGARGVGGNIEFRRKFSLPASTALTPYAYYGAGRVSSTIAGSNQHASASSAGFGLRFNADSFKLYAEADRPLTRDSVYKEDSTRVSAGLQYFLR